MAPNPGSSDSTEVEWQFEAEDLRAVERWLLSQPAHAMLHVTPKGQSHQVDTYFDSAAFFVSPIG